MRTVLVFWIFAITHLLATSVPAGAQQYIRGRVVDAVTGLGLADAEVALVNAEGAVKSSVWSDSTGAFVLKPTIPGTYVLRVRRLGYQELTSREIPVRVGETVEVELSVSIHAFEHEPLVVVSRTADERASFLHPFYERLDRYQRSGRGHFVTREDIERRGGVFTEHLVKNVPGVWVVPSRDGRGYDILMRGVGTVYRCRPQIFLNGMRMIGAMSLHDLVTPNMVEGIEVYRNPSQAPPEMVDPANKCGVIALWTRADVGAPFTMARFATLLGVIAAMVLVHNLVP